MRSIAMLLAFASAACVHRAGGTSAGLGLQAAYLPPVASAGCRAGSVRGSAGMRTITSGGRTRRFWLRLPPGGALSRPTPVVLNFHGLFEPPELQELLTGMTPAAAERGWIVVYPLGSGTSWNAGGCCGRARWDGVDDVSFVRRLVAQLARELCLDRRRVYATGMSNGGLFSYRLACEASDLIAAIAPVAAVEAAPRCQPRRPVPVLAFHGTGDILVRYRGGFPSGSFWDLPSASETFARWARRNGCAAGTTTVFSRGDVACESATSCRAPDILCTVRGGGHTWPGGAIIPYLGSTSSDVDATRTILDFFAAQALGR